MKKAKTAFCQETLKKWQRTQLRQKLKEIEAHHIDLNNRIGRDLERSTTLRLVREALSMLKEA